jgi:hypothetical protein
MYHDGRRDAGMPARLDLDISSARVRSRAPRVTIVSERIFHATF